MGFGISRGDPEWSGEYDSYKESPVSELENGSGVFIGNVLDGFGMSDTPGGRVHECVIASWNDCIMY